MASDRRKGNEGANNGPIPTTAYVARGGGGVRVHQMAARNGMVWCEGEGGKEREDS